MDVNATVIEVIDTTTITIYRGGLVLDYHRLLLQSRINSAFNNTSLTILDNEESH